jgi:hypothetical protein
MIDAWIIGYDANRIVLLTYGNLSSRRMEMLTEERMPTGLFVRLAGEDVSAQSAHNRRGLIVLSLYFQRLSFATRVVEVVVNTG